MVGSGDGSGAVVGEFGHEWEVFVEGWDVACEEFAGEEVVECELVGGVVEEE